MTPGDLAAFAEVMQKWGITRLQYEGVTIEMPSAPASASKETPELPTPPLDPEKERQRMLFASSMPMTDEELEDVVEKERGS